MLGVNDKTWLVDMLCNTAKNDIKSNSNQTLSVSNLNHKQYSVYFGLGQSINLHDRPNVFKVSLAGITLGNYILKELYHRKTSGKFLDIGTGSGVLALLIRSIGATNITATDICENSINLAKENELLNFNNEKILFFCGDLFSNLPNDERYDTIIFNPPGWRTPSNQLLDELKKIQTEYDMRPEAMFFGDHVLLKFLQDLPNRLNTKGRALIGLNSLVGIQDILKGYNSTYLTDSPLNFRLLERHSLPLLFYTPGWKLAEPLLIKEFKVWRDHHTAAYTVDANGQLYWSYEVIECTHKS